jgi:hypothetical protein
MTAVEEYKRHCTSTTLPWATANVNRSVADAAIAELEAEQSKLKANLVCCDADVRQGLQCIAELQAERDRALTLAEQAQSQAVRSADVADTLKAKLAALKERRCDNCVHWKTDGPWDFCLDMYPEFACNRWEFRK